MNTKLKVDVPHNLFDISKYMLNNLNGGLQIYLRYILVEHSKYAAFVLVPSPRMLSVEIDL